MDSNIEIARDSKKWRTYPEINSKLIRLFLANILSRYANFAKIKQVELSILLTNAQKMQQLNAEFRKINSPTNVLSFPDLVIDPGYILEFKVDINYIYLGDIAFGYEIIAAEAKEQNISFVLHFKHLLVHSILHLLGYDHLNDKDAELMESIEKDVLGFFGLTVPSLSSIYDIL